MAKKETGATTKVIEALNAGRARELTAIAQYMQQHYKLEDDGYGKLAKTLKETAIVEMKHAEALAERILFLGGVPTSKPDGEILKNQDIPAILKTAIALEQEAIRMYNASAQLCAAEGDNVSKQLFESLLKDEEEHLNTFETIRDHVEALGAAYLATLAD